MFEAIKMTGRNFLERGPEMSNHPLGLIISKNPIENTAERYQYFFLFIPCCYHLPKASKLWTALPKVWQVSVHCKSVLLLPHQSSFILLPPTLDYSLKSTMGLGNFPSRWVKTCGLLIPWNTFKNQSSPMGVIYSHIPLFRRIIVFALLNKMFVCFWMSKFHLFVPTGHNAWTAPQTHEPWHHFAQKRWSCLGQAKYDQKCGFSSWTPHHFFV